MANLYRDEDDVEEQRVLGGDDFEPAEEEAARPSKPRDAKAHAKSGKPGDLSKPSLISKIPKLVSPSPRASAKLIVRPSQKGVSECSPSAKSIRAATPS